MQGVYSNTALVLPTDWLVWLATSAARMAVYRLQYWHAPLRILHILSTASFFGGILLLDLRLIGLRGRELGVDALARLVLPVLHASFVVLLVSGVMLFMYDPIQAGSHSYFLPKLLLIAAGLCNAALFSLPEGFGLKRLDGVTLTRHARIAGALSVLIWAGVIAAATGNHEERPLVRRNTYQRPAIVLPNE